jgi:hypothetical protein
MLKTLRQILTNSKKSKIAKFSLEIPTVIGAEDKPAMGEVIFHIPPRVTHIRFANTRGSLEFMPWEKIIPKTTEHLDHGDL